MYKNGNKYYKNSKLNEPRFRHILKAFSLDITAVETAKITGVSVRSVNTIFIKMRYRIAEYCEAESPYSNVDRPEESDLGLAQFKRMREQHERGERIVFGLFLWNDYVYTKMVPVLKKEMLEVTRGGNVLGEILHLPGCWMYDGVVELGRKSVFSLRFFHNQSAEEPLFVSRLTSFGDYAKQRLTKFKGLRKRMFYLHLKETEFRFNHRHDSAYKLLIKMLRCHPI